VKVVEFGRLRDFDGASFVGCEISTEQASLRSDDKTTEALSLLESADIKAEGSVAGRRGCMRTAG